MGKVGGAIAFGMLITRGGYNIHIHDSSPKILEAEYQDLRRAVKINALCEDLNKLIKCGDIQPKADIHIICAGERRALGETDNHLFKRNYKTVNMICQRIKSGLIIMVTNPARDLARMCYRNSGVKVVPAGERCDRICNGEEIMKGKGYTNWGIAAEVLEMI
ncbi:MAG: hypothetical protein JSW41_03960 [Candidatus Aenigmatarchaeota archaeon]|nr:MAG: hypothetical protein JSW41_03960 [Candidatus Aenigmarchaeota archaeon]